MNRKSLVLLLSLAVACFAGALSSELFAGKKGDSFLDAAKASAPKSLTLRELRIVDEKGKTRMLLKPDTLEIFDAKGRPRLFLGNVGGDCGFMLGIIDEKRIVRIALDAERLEIADAKGKTRTAIESSSVILLDAQETARIALGPTLPKSDVLYAISFCGPKGTFQGEIMTSPRGAFLRTGLGKGLRIIRLSSLAKPLRKTYGEMLRENRR